MKTQLTINCECQNFLNGEKCQLLDSLALDMYPRVSIRRSNLMNINTYYSSEYIFEGEVLYYFLVMHLESRAQRSNSIEHSALNIHHKRPYETQNKTPEHPPRGLEKGA